MKIFQYLIVGVIMVALCQGAWGQGDTTFFKINASTSTMITAMSPQGVVTWSNATEGITTGQVQRATTLLGQTNWVDYVAFSVTGAVTQLRMMDPNPPADMAYIPAGIFTMGNAIGDNETMSRPPHAVNLSAFYMNKYEITKAQWDAVYKWAITNGYNFANVGSGKENNHPVQMVNWFDVVKWCNARSEKEGLAPAYYTSSNQITVYRTGHINVSNSWVKWSVGYRLPTEAEWECAARGGLSGKRFAWGDIITHNQANYFSNTDFSYDQSATRGLHPIYQAGDLPYTSSVGSFLANGYGLYDMVGNVNEWCWDWYASYSSATQTDPRGSVSGSSRLVRGGSWYDFAFIGRIACRISATPTNSVNYIGFRTVRAAGQ